MSATLAKGINAFREVIDAPIASYFSSCVHCGLCAEACLFYTETGDPKYTPIHKVEPMRRVYEQEYHFLLEFRDGRVSAVREYLDGRARLDGPGGDAR